MADQITGTPGSEQAGSKFVVIIASVIGVLGTLTEILDALSNVIPAAQKGVGLWIAVGGSVIAGLTQIAYTLSRSAVKVAAIRAGGTIPTDPANTKPVDQAAANLGK